MRRRELTQRCNVLSYLIANSELLAFGEHELLCKRPAGGLHLGLECSLELGSNGSNWPYEY